MAEPGFSVGMQIIAQGPYGMSEVMRKMRAEVANASRGLDVGNFSRSSSSVGQLNAQLASTRSTLRGVQTEARDTHATLSRIGSATTGRQLVSELKSASAVMKEVSRNTQEATKFTERLGAQVGISSRRFLAFSIAAGSLYTFVSALKSGVGEALEFDRQMVRIAQVSQDSRKNIASLAQTIGSLSTSLGVSSKELSQTATVFRQAGLDIKETEQALKAVAKAALAPNFDSMAQTAEGAIAVMSQFNVKANELEKSIGSMNAVAGDFAVEAGDLVEAVRRAGGAFSQTGGSLNELLALFTSVRSTTRESAESIATGLRTIFTRVQRADTVDAFKSLGVELRYTRDQARALGDVGLENQFVGAYEAVKRLSEGLKGLRTTDPRYAAAVESLGGYRQVSKVIPLITQFSEAQRALNTAQSGGISLTLATEKAQDALLVKTQKLKEEYLELFRAITDSKAFRSFIDFTVTAGSGMAKLVDIAKPLLPYLGALAAGSLVSRAVPFVGAFTADFRAGPIPPRPRHYASGGYVVPGVGDSDSVPAQLPIGSFVLNKRASRAIGYGQLDAMLTPGEVVFGPGQVNRVGRARLERMNRFAQGGLTERDFFQIVESVNERRMSGELKGDPRKLYIAEGLSRSGVAPLARLIPHLKNFHIVGPDHPALSRRPGTRGFFSPIGYDGDGKWFNGPSIVIRNGPLPQLVTTAAHELAHFGDFAEGKSLGKTGYASNLRGHPFRRVSAANARMFRSLHGEFYHKKKLPIESLAFGVSRYFLGDRSERLAGAVRDVFLPRIEGIADIYDGGGRPRFADGGIVGGGSSLLGDWERYNIPSVPGHGPMSEHDLEKLLLHARLAEKMKRLGRFSQVVGSRHYASGGRVRPFRDRLLELIGKAAKHEAGAPAVAHGIPSDEDAFFTLYQRPGSGAGNAGSMFKVPRKVFRDLMGEGRGRPAPTFVPEDIDPKNVFASQTMRKRRKATDPLDEANPYFGISAFRSFFGRSPRLDLDTTPAEPNDIVAPVVPPMIVQPGARYRKDVWGRIQKDVYGNPVEEDSVRGRFFQGRSGRRYYFPKRRPFADGGEAGGRTTDTIPALLTPGEYVFNPKAVAKLGLSNLHHMNRTGEVPGFARGGYVGMADGGEPPAFVSGFRGVSREEIKVLADALKSQSGYQSKNEPGGHVYFAAGVGKLQEAAGYATSRAVGNRGYVLSIRAPEDITHKQNISDDYKDYRYLESMRPEYVAGYRKAKERESFGFGRGVPELARELAPERPLLPLLERYNRYRGYLQSKANPSALAQDPRSVTVPYGSVGEARVSLLKHGLPLSEVDNFIRKLREAGVALDSNRRIVVRLNEVEQRKGQKALSVAGYEVQGRRPSRDLVEDIKADFEREFRARLRFPAPKAERNDFEKLVIGLGGQIPRDSDAGRQDEAGRPSVLQRRQQLFDDYNLPGKTRRRTVDLANARDFILGRLPIESLHAPYINKEGEEALSRELNPYVHALIARARKGGGTGVLARAAAGLSSDDINSFLTRYKEVYGRTTFGVPEAPKPATIGIARSRQRSRDTKTPQDEVEKLTVTGSPGTGWRDEATGQYVSAQGRRRNAKGQWLSDAKVRELEAAEAARVASVGGVPPATPPKTSVGNPSEPEPEPVPGKVATGTELALLHYTGRGFRMESEERKSREIVPYGHPVPPYIPPPPSPPPPPPGPRPSSSYSLLGELYIDRERVENPDFEEQDKKRPKHLRDRRHKSNERPFNDATANYRYEQRRKAERRRRKAGPLAGTYDLADVSFDPNDPYLSRESRQVASAAQRQAYLDQEQKQATRETVAGARLYRRSGSIGASSQGFILGETSLRDNDLNRIAQISDPVLRKQKLLEYGFSYREALQLSRSGGSETSVYERLRNENASRKAAQAAKVDRNASFYDIKAKALGAASSDEAYTHLEAARRAGGASEAQLRSLEKSVANKFGGRTGPGGITPVREISVSNLVSKGVESQLNARGGFNAVSTQTKGEILSKEEERVRQELIEAERKLVKALIPAASTTESYRIAAQNVEEAMRHGATVITSTSGEVVGLKSTADQLSARGINAVDVGRSPRYLASRVRAGGQNALRRFSNYRNQFLEKHGNAVNYGLFGLAVAGGYTADAIERAAGPATASSGQGFRAARGTSGLLQGVIGGATAGSFTGTPQGIAIGAIIGGLTGLVSSLKNAETEIRSIRIDEAVASVSERLSLLAGGLKDAGTVALTLRNIEKTISESSAKNAAESGTFSFDPEAYASAQKRSLRQSFGPQLGNITQVLSNQVEEIVRQTKGEGAPADIFQRLQTGNGGLNRQLLSIVSQLRELPPDLLEKEFRKSILSQQLGEKARLTTTEPSTVEDRNVSAFGRLVASVQAASDSLEKFGRESDRLAEQFAGTVSATRFSAGTERLDRLGAPGGGTLPIFKLLSSVGGEAGSKLASTGEAANAIASVLPSVLATANSQGRKTGQVEDFPGAVRGLLEKSFAGRLTPDIRAGITSVLNQLNQVEKTGAGAAREKIGIDVSKFSEELINPFAEPVKVAGKQVGQLLEQQGQRLAEGLVEVTRQAKVIGEGRDRAVQIRTAGRLQEIEYEAANRFRRGGLPLDVPLGLVNAPIQSRQERLTGLAGGAANDVGRLRRLFESTNQQIASLEEQARQAFSENKPYKDITDEVTRLKAQSSNYLQALEHLTNASERNAAAQEKLRAIEEDRRGRLQLGEGLFAGGIEGLLRFRRAQADLPIARRNPAAFLGQPERASNVLGLLHATENVRFRNGQTGGDIREELLTKFNNQLPFGLGQPLRLKQEREGLRGSVGTENTRAEQAQIALNETLKNTSTDFFKKLEEQHSKFFSQLSSFLKQDHINRLETERGGLSRTKGDLAELQRQRIVLGRAGVTSDGQLRNLKGALPEIEDLVAQQDEVRWINSRRTSALSAEGLKKAYAAYAKGGPQALTDLLSDKYGFEGESLSRIVDPITLYQKGNEVRRSQFFGLNAPTAEEERGTVLRLFSKGVNEATKEDVGQLEKDKLGETRKNVHIRGFNPDEILRVVGRFGGIDSLKAAIAAFDGTGKKLDGLSDSIFKTSQDFNSLTDSINKLKREQGEPEGGYRAAGGPFKARGTDTVPAMLTPGEFVVNAQSAKANADLLRKINGADGPVYRAEGGPISEFERAMRTDTRNVGEIRAALEQAGGAMPHLSDPKGMTEWRRRRLLAFRHISSGIQGARNDDQITGSLHSLYEKSLAADANAPESTQLSSSYGPLQTIDRLLASVLVPANNAVGSFLHPSGNPYLDHQKYFVPSNAPHSFTDSLPFGSMTPEAREQNRRRLLSDAEKQQINIAEAAPFEISQGAALVRDTARFRRQAYAGKIEQAKGLALDRARRARADAANEAYKNSPENIRAEALRKQNEEAHAALFGLDRPSRKSTPSVYKAPTKPTEVDRLLAESAELRSHHTELPPDVREAAIAAGVLRGKKSPAVSIEQAIARQKAKDAERARIMQEKIKGGKFRNVRLGDASIHGVAPADVHGHIRDQKENDLARSELLRERFLSGEFDKFHLNSIPDTGELARRRRLGLRRAKPPLPLPAVPSPLAPDLIRDTVASVNRFIHGDFGSPNRRRRRGGHHPATPFFDPFVLRQQQLGNFRARSLFANTYDPLGRPGYGDSYGAAEASYRTQYQGMSGLASHFFGARSPQFFSLPVGFAAGGTVPDQIPAMLTEGEFVLNRQAVARAGVGNLQRFNAGGPVGSPAGSQQSGTGISQEVAKALTQFGQSTATLSQTMTIFAGSAAALSKAIDNMPRSMTMQGQHNMTVTMNGAEVLSKLEPALKEFVVSKIKEQISQVFREHMPDAGVPRV